MNQKNSNNNYTLFTINPNKKIESSQNLVKLLIQNGLIKNDIKNDLIKKVNPDKLEKYIVESLENGKISYTEYIKYYIEAGAIMLLEYLMYKNLITQIEFKIAIAIQIKERENNNNLKIGEILIEKKLIKNFHKFAMALKELGLLKIGEYFVGIGKISKNELNTFLKIQKESGGKLSLGKIIQKEKNIPQDEINNILEKIGIKVDNSEIGIYDLKDDTFYKNN